MKQCWLIVLLAAAGCSAARTVVPPLPPGDGIAAGYRIGCPDVLEIQFAEGVQPSVAVSVDVDGRVPLPGVGRPRVEGLTAAEAAAAVAALADLPDEAVTLRVAEPRSATIVITGPDNRRSAILPYTGPEPVLDYLRRAEMIPVGSSRLKRVYVLRSNVATGTPPQLFHIDVESVLFEGDTAGNLPLEPGDHIYIGETRRSSISRLLPDWLKPVYRKIVGLLPEVFR